MHPRTTANQLLHGITQTREVEITDLERRHDDRRAGAAVFTCAHSYRRAECFDVVEHEDRGLVVSKVLDRVRHLAVLDQERTVARETREQDGALIDGANVPETRYEDSALGARDHLRDR